MDKAEILKRAKEYIAAARKLKNLWQKKILQNWKTDSTELLNLEQVVFVV